MVSGMPRVGVRLVLHGGGHGPIVAPDASEARPLVSAGGTGQVLGLRSWVLGLGVRCGGAKSQVSGLGSQVSGVGCQLSALRACPIDHRNFCSRRGHIQDPRPNTQDLAPET
jgi:hypothetical protein